MFFSSLSGFSKGALKQRGIGNEVPAGAEALQQESVAGFCQGTENNNDVRTTLV